jgi:hypothetical protein
MLRFLAKTYARLSYLFQLEVEAAKSEINAAIAKRNADDKRKLAEDLNADADAMDKRIADMVRMEEEEYYLCDNGHEKGGAFQPGADGESRKCIECNAPAKFIKRSEMSGQEKYESDKRKLAEERGARYVGLKRPRRILSAEVRAIFGSRLA